MQISWLESTAESAGPGIFVALAGAIGLLVVMRIREVWIGIDLERRAVLDRERSVEHREAAVEQRSHALAEWEGRLLQVAECGCRLPCGFRPTPDREI